jgi:F0F1-type ATP synthase alpha subunit
MSIENLSQKIFNSEPEIQAEHQHALQRAMKIKVLLKQERLELFSIEEQCLLLFTGIYSFIGILKLFLSEISIFGQCKCSATACFY